MSPKNKPFWDHVEDLRRLILQVLAIALVGFVASLICYRPLFELLTWPLKNLPIGLEQMVLLSPTEGMVITLKVAFWSGLVLTAPIWGFQVLRYVRPALRGEERRWIFPFVILSLLGVSSGFTMALGLSLPVANSFLYRFNAHIGQNLWSLGHTINFTILFMLAHAIAFELFAILLCLVHLGKIGPETLARKRRLVIVAIFVLSAVLTPPDIVTQCLLAGPLWLLYEGAILYARVRNYRLGT